VLYVYTKDAEGKIHSRRDIGVFFIPMTGAIAKSTPVRPETVSDHPPAETAAPQVDKPAEAKPAEAKPDTE
jgi:protein-L-isoaspartate(D-aspartate) O-methyltransferase